MAVAGLLCFAFAAACRCRRPTRSSPRTVVATGLLIVESGVAAGQYGSIFVWATLICAYYFPRRVAVAHLVWLLAVYAGTLALVESTAGYSPLTRWLFTAISLTVVMMLISAIVAHRARADVRARRFFDLSHDMLSTMDVEGRCVEVNDAWRRWLGYAPRSLPAGRCSTSPTPTTTSTRPPAPVALFKGAESVDLETRVRAKDGSWHWLRTSSASPPDEELVYSRSTDVTELRRWPPNARSCWRRSRAWPATTPSPGCRTGARSTSRCRGRWPGRAAAASRSAWRSSTSTTSRPTTTATATSPATSCCGGARVAWDAELRGADTIVRFGGEEFLVLLPETGAEDARRSSSGCGRRRRTGRPARPGIAVWDFDADIDELIRAADRALYRAKDERPRPGRRWRSSEPGMIARMGRAEHDRTVRFRSARRDPELTVVEGFHALKHALRFGAEVVEAVAVDPPALEALAAELAPDLAGRFAPLVETVDAATLAELVPLVPRTGVVAIARRPPLDLAAALADPAPAPVVLLEQPRNMGNIGACVRVAAAAGAAALLDHRRERPLVPGRRPRRRRAAVRAAGGAGRELSRRGSGRCWRSTPRGSELAPGALPRAGRARLRDRARGGLRRAARAGRRPGRDPDAAPASPASTWRPRSRSSSSPVASGRAAPTR